MRCVARDEVFGTGHTIGQQNTVFIVPGSDLSANTVSLRFRESSLRLRVHMRYSVVSRVKKASSEDYDVSITQYRYDVLDLSGQELFVYHWHPDGLSDVDEPHLHIAREPFTLSASRPGREARSLAIDKAHFPTGHVTIPQVIRFLIRDLGVEPRVADWERVLGAVP
jgi:hypothetical protein